MADRSVEEFRGRREAGNEAVLACGHQGVTRFFRLDAAAYEPGALSAKNKELLGLVASLVLRCNDCVDYHLERCVEHGWTKDEVVDAMNVGLVVGGSIVIPHLRHAVTTLNQLPAAGQ